MFSPTYALWGLFGTGVLLVGATLLAAAPATQDVFPVPQLASVAPWAWPGLVVAALLALGEGRLPLAGWIFVGAFGVFLWTNYALPVRASGTGAAVELLAVNADQGGVDPAQVAREVARRHVDVLVVVELTPALDAALRAQPALAGLPHRVLHPADAASGSGLYARYPLTATPDIVGTSFHLVTARVAVPGARPWRLAAVHVYPLVPFAESGWTADFTAIRRWTADGDTSRTVLAGDFNATRDHRHFRGLTAVGLSEARRSPFRPIGGGTWPSWVPLVALDHVLVGDALHATGHEIVSLDGTDHRGVAVQVREAG